MRHNGQSTSSIEVNIDTLEANTDGLETLNGAVNETAPATDTASSGLNGRLQRVAQRLTTLMTGAGLAASAAFTPAAASHANGDVNGGAQEFALAAPSACVFEIQSATLLIAGGTIETTAWALHLFSVTPPSALADDAPFTLASGDRASYLGFVSLAQVVDYGDSLFIQGDSINKKVKLAGTSLFGYLVNGTTLTPQAVAHTVTLIGKPVMS